MLRGKAQYSSSAGDKLKPHCDLHIPRIAPILVRYSGISHERDGSKFIRTCNTIDVNMESELNRMHVSVDK